MIKGKPGVSGNVKKYRMTSPDPILFFIYTGLLLQYERNYGNYNEDNYEPFCNLHRESCYPFHAQYKKNQGKDQENYRKVN